LLAERTSSQPAAWASCRIGGRVPQAGLTWGLLPALHIIRASAIEFNVRKAFARCAFRLANPLIGNPACRSAWGYAQCWLTGSICGALHTYCLPRARHWSQMRGLSHDFGGGTRRNEPTTSSMLFHEPVSNVRTRPALRRQVFHFPANLLMHLRWFSAPQRDKPLNCSV
jgi:hypothetical protein